MFRGWLILGKDSVYGFRDVRLQHGLK